MLAPAGRLTVAFGAAVVLERLTELGETAQDEFAGPPEHVSDTVPIDPFKPVTPSVKLAFFPVTDCEAGVTDRVKSAACTETLGDVL